MGPKRLFISCNILRKSVVSTKIYVSEPAIGPKNLSVKADN